MCLCMFISVFFTSVLLLFVFVLFFLIQPKAPEQLLNKHTVMTVVSTATVGIVYDVVCASKMTNTGMMICACVRCCTTFLYFF